MTDSAPPLAESVTRNRLHSFPLITEGGHHFGAAHRWCRQGTGTVCAWVTLMSWL